MTTETKTFTQEQLDAAVAKATGDVEGLKEKVAELIASEKKWKAEARKASEIKPEDMAALESDNEKLRADLAAANKTAKDATAAAEKAAKALEAEQGVTHKLVADSGLRELLLKGGVTDPDFLDMAVGKYLPAVKVVVDGETRKAMHGDKPLEDFVKELLASDAGKKIVAAPINGGGGAPGGKGGEGGKTITRTAFDAMPHAERMTAIKDGATVADA